MKKISYFFLVLCLISGLLSCAGCKKEDASAITVSQSDSDAGQMAKEDTTSDSQEEDLAPTEPPLNITAWTTTLVNLRSEPSTEASVITKLARKTELTELYEMGEWTQVSVGGQTGYVAASYLTREEPTTNGQVVVIDAGHQQRGNSEQEPIGPGASATKAKVAGGTSGVASGLKEYELTLQVALKLQAELEQRGYDVIMVRTSNDVNISNAQRAQVANNAGADAFIRIHANGANDASTSGAMTICQTPQNPYNGGMAASSKALSTAVLDGVCAATGCRRQYVWETDSMSGINWASVPVTIIEMGYMTNPTEDANLASADYQQKMAMGMANGIDAFLGN